ncbi:hypothetical protein KAFR_0D00550 [Kazachstania africana CBS 2517]|uniref:Phosphatidylethanolamine-binding protein n=1 Tax=Kazachstania africana (strain ATCC 22294 / BCRC 22015 / CBS 2517 / CECT 1963 / NBRC 1671 / NRRL Y-8276) TaxID=1071382 RepID=H2ATK2_KAZAF|nr:hypothetical protein KAFR_0D00550 [Kazachstania africana CBS 2517]CCF57702.1 hypothetical protein KAFR_0D00550 [Kazachstania africana CBS 2517]
MYSASETIAALNKEDIVKDVFYTDGDAFQPKGNLLVEYPTADTVVKMGNVLPTETTQVMPKVEFKPYDDFQLDLNATYSLIMTDPDAPSRTDHKWSEVCHYVETGITFESAQGGVISNKGLVRESYLGPGPPKGTGLHRYIFLLYKENNAKDHTFTEVKDRLNWGYGEPAVGVDKFAAANNLELLAANFFLAENK